MADWPIVFLDNMTLARDRIATITASKGNVTIATFITTIKFMQQGIKGINETTTRAAAVKVWAKKMGVKIRDVYWILGEYDGVLIFDAPNDEAASAMLLHLGNMGNVHTTTCRAYTAVEMDKILAKVHVD